MSIWCIAHRQCRGRSALSSSFQCAPRYHQRACLEVSGLGWLACYLSSASEDVIKELAWGVHDERAESCFDGRHGNGSHDGRSRSAHARNVGDLGRLTRFRVFRFRVLAKVVHFGSNAVVRAMRRGPHFQVQISGLGFEVSGSSIWGSLPCEKEGKRDEKKIQCPPYITE